MGGALDLPEPADPQAPCSQGEDLAKGKLEAIDMDSYRAEKKAAMQIRPADQYAQIRPLPVEGWGRKSEPEMGRLSNILKTFNDQFGTLFNGGNRVDRRTQQDNAPQVAADEAYQNAKQN